MISYRAEKWKLWRLSHLKWYNDMTEQEKRSFKKVIVVCVVGAILILIVPMVFMLISKLEITSKFIGG